MLRGTGQGFLCTWLSGAVGAVRPKAQPAAGLFPQHLYEGSAATSVTVFLSTSTEHFPHADPLWFFFSLQTSQHTGPTRISSLHGSECWGRPEIPECLNMWPHSLRRVNRGLKRFSGFWAQGAPPAGPSPSQSVLLCWQNVIADCSLVWKCVTASQFVYLSIYI